MYYIFDFTSVFHYFFNFFLLTLFLLVISLDHFLITLLFLDLLLLVNILLLIFCAQVTANDVGYNYALLLLGVAAADTSVGLGLFILYFKTFGSVSVK